MSKISNGQPHVRSHRNPATMPLPCKSSTSPTPGYSDTRRNPFPIGDLPMDLLLLIVDHLSGPSKVLLAFTCRTFYTYFGPVKMSNLTEPDRVEVLTAMARSRPDHTVCHYHECLHRADRQVLPAIHPRRPNEEIEDAYRNADITRNLDLHEPFYVLLHSHITLALKYARLGIHAGYIRKVLAPLSFKGYCPATCFDRAPYRSDKLAYRAAPRLFGKSRFLLAETWRIDNEDCLRMRICPHTWVENLWFPPPDSRKDGANTVIKRVESACRSCRTDWQAVVYTSRWIIRAWKDMGTEEREDAVYRCEWADTWYSVAIVRGLGGQVSRHEKGSIRKMYIEALNTE